MNRYMEREVDFYLSKARLYEGCTDNSGVLERRPDILREIDSCFEDRVPERYRGLTLMAIQESMGIPKQMEAGWNRVSGWMRERQPGDNLILSGPVGTGKTTIACGIIQSIALQSEACRYGFRGTKRESVWYQSMNTLADIIAASRGRWRSESMDPMGWLSQAAVLVVDDLGVIPPEGWVQKKFEEILCQRYDEKRTTIITSNLGIVSLSTVLDRRVVDRLQQTGTFVTLDGSSLRSAANRGTGIMASESGASMTL